MRVAQDDRRPLDFFAAVTTEIPYSLSGWDWCAL
jgi:hypothetical protein